ncbi:nucleoside deaminase [Anaerobranca gottschalkii]|uniref:tRNA-specific adenosine deaminase n=1 Tax=Anaerobranca gottschalkii DSM 13577 TaxID=1120990 RepID=A0A1I0BBG6_9FIRM|nr:nucleoside deaminase [Anaerobranca gottschalkii]SET04165.1 tRNA(adenine34) deaminase [Anaerobranca gottschalkii DSM 13577]
MKEKFMHLALEQANKAFELGEVPIGAVVIRNNEVISLGFNMRETLKDPTAHAELIAIKRAAQKLQGWRLIDCEIYVNVEPCAMCCEAIIQSRMKKLIFGLREPKTGAVYSQLELPKIRNAKLEIEEGILEEESKRLLQKFFNKIRNK